MKIPISVVVITKNEAHNIAGCLESAKWADEIVVIDSHSEDSTVSIAKEYTDKIHSVDTDNFSQKRIISLGITKNDWILFLDADERITDELRDEMMSLSEGCDNSVTGYKINRKNYCFGKWIKHCGIYPDYHIRLFNKQHAQITERIVHEGVKVTGNVQELKGHLIHYSFIDLTGMINKINMYSTFEAREKLEQNKQISKAGVFTHAISAFLRVFISRKGYKDRLEGFFISFSYAMVNFLSHLKLLKLQSKL